MLRVVFLSIALLTVGCSGELDRHIKIVLPNDDQGEFTIVKDENGDDIDRTPDFDIDRIPTTGEL